MQEVTFGLRSTGFSGLGGSQCLLKEGDMLDLFYALFLCCRKEYEENAEPNKRSHSWHCDLPQNMLPVYSLSSLNHTMQRTRARSSVVIWCNSYRTHPGQDLHIF